MRKIFSTLIVLCLLLALQVSSLAALDDGGRLFAVKSGELVGFIDVTGTVIIPLQFLDAGMFSEGLAPVQDTTSGKWGYIDQTGNFVIQPQFEMAFRFDHGLAKVFLNQGGSGYIDTAGSVVIKGGVTRFVSDGLVLLTTHEKTVFTDMSGKTLFQGPGNAWPVGGGLIAFRDKWWMGFMDRHGAVVIKPMYHCDVNWRDRQFIEKITPVSTVVTADGKEKFGFIDLTGKTVVDFQYDWAEQFFNGLAKVSKDGKYGYVNAAGEVVIPLAFDGADHFSEGLAAVAIGDRWGFINTNGQMVIKPQYLSRMWGSPMIFKEGLAAVRTETGTGFINRDGEMVVPPVYRSVDDFIGGLAIIGSSHDPTYVNRRGEVVWPHN